MLKIDNNTVWLGVDCQDQESKSVAQQVTDALIDLYWLTPNSGTGEDRTQLNDALIRLLKLLGPSVMGMDGQGWAQWSEQLKTYTLPRSFDLHSQEKGERHAA